MNNRILILILLLFLNKSTMSNDFSSPFHPFKSQKAKEKYLAFNQKESLKWPVPCDTQYVSTSYGKTFVRISGPLDAPPMVLIPGGAVSSLIWIPNIKDFSKGFRVYAIDNIYDFGKSVNSRKMTESSDFVGWLDELFDTLSLRKDISLIGLSNGGAIVAQYALHKPSRLKRTVLMAPAFTILPIKFEFWFRVSLCFLPGEYFKKSFGNWIFADLAKLPGTSNKQDNPDETAVAMVCFKIKNPVFPKVLTDNELGRIKVPILFMIGENEKIYSVEKAIKRIKRTAPSFQVSIIKNAGHDLTIVQSDSVDKMVVAFLMDKE